MHHKFLHIPCELSERSGASLPPCLTFIWDLPTPVWWKWYVRGYRYMYTRYRGPWFNIKMLSNHYRKSHHKDEMVKRPSLLYHGYFYTGITHLYIESSPCLQLHGNWLINKIAVMLSGGCNNLITWCNVTCSIGKAVWSVPSGVRNTNSWPYVYCPVLHCYMLLPAWLHWISIPFKCPFNNNNQL